MKFLDVNTYDPGSGYLATNEDLLGHEEVLTDAGITQAGKIGGIASAGDVLLFNLLPRLTETGEAIMVDHSYYSLSWTFLKLHWLKTRGPAGLKNLFSKSIGKVSQVVQETLPEIPEVLRVRRQSDYDYKTHTYSVKVITHKLLNPDKNGPFDTTYFESLRTTWREKITIEALEKAVKRLDQVTLIHGDLSDLKNYGKFNVLYISNATGHTGRIGPPTWEIIAGLVEDSGIVLETGNDPHDNKRKRHPYFSPVTSANYKSPEMSWGHFVYQKSGDSSQKEARS